MGTRGSFAGDGSKGPVETSAGLTGSENGEAATSKVNPDMEDDLRSTARTQDEYSTRAKSSGHGKVTADNWNQ